MRDLKIGDRVDVALPPSQWAEPTSPCVLTAKIVGLTPRRVEIRVDGCAATRKVRYERIAKREH